MLKISKNLIHGRINAIKFYFEQMLRRDKLFFIEIPRLQKKLQLPEVFSKSDISKLFSKTFDDAEIMPWNGFAGKRNRESEDYRH
jgi:hypothetical protein